MKQPMRLCSASNVALLVACLVQPLTGWADVLITDVLGKPGLVSKPPLAILSEISNGGAIDLPSGFQFSAIDLATGKEYVASGPGRFRISSSGVLSATTGTVKIRSVTNGALPDVKIATGKISQAAMTMRGDVALLGNPPGYPANTVITDTATATLRWSHMAGASSYRVTVSDDTSKVIWQRNTTEAQLALTPDAGIQPGRRYAWTVEPLNQTGAPTANATRATFSVVAADVARILKAIKPEPNAPLSAWVLYAAQLQQAGATDDAQAIWEALGHERPNDPNLKKLVK